MLLELFQELRRSSEKKEMPRLLPSRKILMNQRRVEATPLKHLPELV